MLQIAKILKSNGTDGGMLFSFRDIDVTQIDLKEPVFINFDGLPVPFFILDIQKKGYSKAVVHLNDVMNLPDAEEMVGREVYLDVEAEDQDDEDLTGWTLLNRGEELGVVSGMEFIPGNPCLYVGDVMIPLHEDFILSADPDSRVLDLDLPDGLL